MASTSDSGSHDRRVDPSVKTCPVCSVTMLATDVNEAGGEPAGFDCPRCGCVITTTTTCGERRG
jgi:hypothetical protein